MTDVSAVAAALEELRLAEARLERRREVTASPSAIERSVLRYVFERADDDEAATPSEIAEHVGLTRPAVSLVLRQLEEQRLIRTEVHPRDGRSKRVLPVSRNDHLDGDDALTDRIRAAASTLDARDGEVVLGFLEQLREVIDRADPTTHRRRRVEV